MFGYMAYDYLSSVPLEPYSYQDEARQSIALRAALDRDDRLNPEERRAKTDAILDCEYGPGFLLRAHP